MVCFGSHMHLQPRLVKHRADSDAKIREAMQSVHQLQGGGGVEPARRLVEEDEGRVRHQLQPDVDTLALATGEAAARGVADDCVPLRGGVAAVSSNSTRQPAAEAANNRRTAVSRRDRWIIWLTTATRIA